MVKRTPGRSSWLIRLPDVGEFRLPGSRLTLHDSEADDQAAARPTEKNTDADLDLGSDESDSDSDGTEDEEVPDALPVADDLAPCAIPLDQRHRDGHTGT